jgi:hypothetical protein
LIVLPTDHLDAPPIGPSGTLAARFNCFSTRETAKTHCPEEGNHQSEVAIRKKMKKNLMEAETSRFQGLTDVSGIKSGFMTTRIPTKPFLEVLMYALRFAERPIAGIVFTAPPRKTRSIGLPAESFVHSCTFPWMSKRPPTLGRSIATDLI